MAYAGLFKNDRAYGTLSLSRSTSDEAETDVAMPPFCAYAGSFPLYSRTLRGNTIA